MSDKHKLFPHHGSAATTVGVTPAVVTLDRYNAGQRTKGCDGQSSAESLDGHRIGSGFESLAIHHTKEPSVFRGGLFLFVLLNRFGFFGRR